MYMQACNLATCNRAMNSVTLHVLLLFPTEKCLCQTLCKLCFFNVHFVIQRYNMFLQEKGLLLMP